MSAAHSGRASPPASAQQRPLNPSAGHAAMVVVVDPGAGVVVVVDAVVGEVVVLVVDTLVVVVPGVGTAAAKKVSAEMVPSPVTMS
ncbi:MAG: hypothetical protein E6I48_14740 [Chloroflexi bacterium]|nr:MAG: hypothetical protein E6I48_14740 [Chloroflexota bacterium]